jgi:hypothetical protein
MHTRTVHTIHHDAVRRRTRRRVAVIVDTIFNSVILVDAVDQIFFILPRTLSLLGNRLLGGVTSLLRIARHIVADDS